MNMNLSELINEIVADWAYRVNDGMPNPKNPMHVKELEIVLNEMGLGHVKSEILQSLNEAEEGGFTNPALNKKVRYKNDKGEDKEGIVGNLLRQPEDSPGRKAAEAALPPEGSPERDAMNQELGSEKDGKAKAPEDGKGKEGEDGKEGGADAEAEKKKKAAAMFDPKADPAMGARLDREKAANDKLAQKDKEDSETGQSPSDKAAQDTIKQASDKANDTIKQASDKANAEFKDKADKVAKDKEAAKKKGYNDSLHAMSDDQLDKSLNASIEKQNSLRRSGDNRGADKARIDYAMHKIEKNRRGNPSSEEIDNDFGLKDYKAEYEKSYGEPYEADIPYPNSDGGERTSAKWGGDEPTAKGGPGSGRRPSASGEQPTGPAGGPNAEPPKDEPSKPDITPPTDSDVPDANSPNDVELSPKEKYKKAKKEKDDAEKQLSDLEQLKKDHPEQFVTPEKQAAWEKNKEILATKKDEIDALNKQIDADKEKREKAQGLEPVNDDPTSNARKFKGETSGKDIQTIELEGGGRVFGTVHGNTKMVDDIVNHIKNTIPEEKWKDVVFVGEGGATNDAGELEFHDEMIHATDKFKEMGAGIDTFDGDELDVHNDQSDLYKKQKEKTGLNDSQVKAGNWASMIGQGEGTDTMSPNDFLDDDGKTFLNDAAKEAGFAPIENWDNPTDTDKDTLYRLAFPEDNGDKETKINDIQVAFNNIRDENIIEKTKKLTAQGKIPITVAGEGHIDLVDKMTKKSSDTKPEETPKQEPSAKPKTPPKATKDDIKNEKPGKEAKTDSGGSLYSIGGGYYSDKPNGPAKYVRTESVIEMAFGDSLNEDVFALFEKSITGTLQNGEKITVQELPPRAVKKATQRAKAAAASSKEEPAQQPTASAEKPAETPKAQSKAGDFNPINANDVQKEMPKANPETFGSEPDIPTGIEPKDLEQFNTDIDKVAKEISDAKERGEKAPNINLCDVTVPGTNLYCDDNLGIPRKEMPQFKGKPQPGTPAADMPVDKNGEVDTEPLFKKMLEDKGIKVVQTEVPSDKLKATQSELVGDKVIGMMNALENDPNHPSITAPIYVSRDGYVIDGHHRWAAITAYNAKNPDSQIPMKVQAIDMDIKEAIPMCNDFAEQQGVAAKKADANQESDIQNVTSLPEPKPEDPEEKKNWFQKQKERIQQKIKVMSEAGKQFFGRGGHKPGSVPRRSFGQALVDKIKGIPKAVKDGIVHHAVMFKDAGVAIFEAGAYGGLGTIEDPETGERFNHDDHIAKDENGKKRYEKIPQYETDSHGHIINDPETGKPMQKRHWLTGNLMNEERPIPNEDMSDKQKELFYKSYKKEKKQIKAIVGTGKAIMITAAGAYGLSAAMGHAYTTAGQLMTSTAIELVPHTIVEGVVLGTGKAALYAGAVEMNHKKKLEEFSTNLVKTIGEYISSDKEIPADVLANSMELYNNIDKLRENMDKIPDDEGFLKDYVELHDQIEKDSKTKKEMKIESLIKEIISEINLEAKGEQFKAKSKDSGKVVVFKSKDAMDAAVKSGSHNAIDTKQNKTDEPVKGASMFGADYQKDRGGVAKGGPGSGRRPAVEPEKPKGTAKPKTDAEFLWMKANRDKINNLLKRRYPDMDDSQFNKKANDVIKATWDSIKDKPQAQQGLPRVVDPEAPQTNPNRNIVQKGGAGSGRDSADIAKAKIDLRTKYPDWDDTKINATARALMAHTRIGKQPFKKTVMKNVFKKRLDNAIPKEVRGFSADDFSTVPGEVSNPSKEFSGFYHRGGGYYSQTADGPITHILKKLTNESISEAGKPQQSKVKKTDLVPIADLDLTASQKGAVTKVANAAKKEIKELPSPKDEATKKKYRESTKKSVVDSLKLTKSEVAKKEAAEKAELANEIKAWEKRKADAKKKGEPFKEPKPKKKNRGVGLGSPDSRAGESAVVLGSIRIKEIMNSGKSYEQARNMVAAELKKFVGPDSYLTDSWIKSALNTLDLMEREIGFNNVEEFGWDNPEGRALVGSQNHGTSSDMFVKTKDGKRIGVSLKKDLKVFIFNGGYTEMSENLKERGFNLSENSAPEHYVQRRTEEFAQGVKDITKNKKAACAAWEGMKKKPADTFDPLDKRVAHILKRTGKKKLKDVSCDDFVNNILTDTGGDSMKLLSQFYQNPEISKISPAYGKLRGLDREMTDSIAKDFGTSENQKIVKDLVRDETHISDILFGENPNLDELKVVYGTDPAIEMKKEKLVQLFGIDKEYAKFEKETDPKKKAAIKKKIEDAINDKISVSTKGGVMSIAISVKDSNGKESAIPLFEAKIRTRGIGAAPTFEMAQNTFGGLAFKYGTSDYTKWDEKDRKVVVGSSLNDLEEEFGSELGHLDKKTQAEIALRLQELDKISPNHPKVKAFRQKYIDVVKK